MKSAKASMPTFSFLAPSFRAISMNVFMAGRFIEFTSAVANEHLTLEVFVVVRGLPPVLVLGVVVDDGAVDEHGALRPPQLLERGRVDDGLEATSPADGTPGTRG
jgi:hypothetical protein